jgi:hypothetical protein
LSELWVYVDAKNTANRASTIEEQARLKIKHLEKDLEEKEPQVAKTERQNTALQNEIAAGLKAKSDLNVSERSFSILLLVNQYL